MKQPHIGEQTVVKSGGPDYSRYQVNTYGPNGWLITPQVKSSDIERVKAEQLARLKGCRMTPSQQAKAYGLPTLSEGARIAGINHDTLRKWHKSKPQLFKTVCIGAVVMNGLENKPSMTINLTPVEIVK